MPKIKNISNAPRIVSGVLVQSKGGVATLTDEQFEAFSATPAGKHALRTYFEVIGDATEAETDKTRTGDFKIDPERHIVEHRGGGRWYVMDGEEKVLGPMTKEDADKYQAILDAASEDDDKTGDEK